MSARTVSLVLALLAVSAPAQTRRVTHALFAADFPEGWRAMTPDEMFAMQDRLPFAMREVQPGFYFAIGDVERWQTNGFDGRALLVDVQTGEIPVTEESIETIRSHWANAKVGGAHREVQAAELVTLGPDAHPAIRCRVLTAADGETPPILADELYVPTSGRLLILSFRSWQDDFENVRAVYDSIAASLTFPRPPRGPEELSDRLWDAAMIGLVVGAAIVLLRMMRRRAPAPSS